jgi:hypothetical protein
VIFIVDISSTTFFLFLLIYTFVLIVAGIIGFEAKKDMKYVAFAQIMVACVAVLFIEAFAVLVSGFT